MSVVLLAHTFRSQRTKLLAVTAGLALWGSLFPIIYATFGAEFKQLVDSGAFGEMFEVFSRFTGGNVFSLAATLSTGFIHPITIALVAVFAIGFPAAAVAGERQRGTLEVLLARPIDRRVLYLTLLVAMLTFIALAEAAMILGAIVGAVLFDVAGELTAGALLGAWLNGFLLFAAIGGLGLAASVSFDRLTPALGVTLAVTIISYAAYFLALLWPDARWLGPYSVFHYFPASEVLAGDLDPRDLFVLLGGFALTVGYSLIAFPRRDLAAPS